MESMYLSTAARRDHALRVRAVTPVALSGAQRGVELCTAGTRVVGTPMQHVVNVAFTSIDPKQGRPPRGVPR
jgi:hypothetical protein